jgi:hypothetical protein
MIEPMLTWEEFARQEHDLASFGAGRLAAAPAYLATIRATGAPRIHPVTPIIAATGLFVFMEPTSPKRRDLEERHWYALHSGVPDNEGSGGEFLVTGHGLAVGDPAVRVIAEDAATYDPVESYVLFELRLTEARCNGYGDTTLPPRRRWTAGD